jgi:putative addiction module killer protein
MGVNTLIHTPQFDAWLLGLNDGAARGRIAIRLRRAGRGNFGDCKSVGRGVSEMRIDYGPGYRVYFALKQDVVYVILWGGDKDSQHRDIRRAQDLWEEMKP